MKIRCTEAEITFDQLDEMDCVEVIRCQDCRMRWHDGYCMVMKKVVPNDGYCHEGCNEEEASALDQCADDAKPRGFVADEWYRENVAETYKG